MSDIEGSEPDWHSRKGSDDGVWATTEFQTLKRCTPVKLSF
jgi:hypothetical protein